MTRLSIFVVALTLTPVWSHAATEVRTERFLVIADIDAETASRAAAYLQATRDRYQSLGFYTQTPREIVVLIVPTLADLEGYLTTLEQRRGQTQAFSLRGIDRHYIVVAWEGSRDPFKPLAHELAHLTEKDPDGPIWFREGFADYLSQLRPDREGVLRPTPSLSHLQRLGEQDWIPWRRLLEADRQSLEFQRPLFYSQSWLATAWLAARQERLRDLEPDALSKVVSALGPEALTAHLEAFAGQLNLAYMDLEAVVPETSQTGRVLEEWEYPFWLAELHRALQHHEIARAKLTQLAGRRPGRSRIEASLGALAMDQGRYLDAEEHFARAARSGALEARMHRRYALTLLAPGPGAAQDRAGLAVAHALEAVELEPHDSSAKHVLAQAYMVAGRWSDSADTLRGLAQDPDWRERAEAEFAELERRRNRRMRSVEPPLLEVRAPQAPLSLESALPSRVPKPPTPPAKPKPPKRRWPPPGSAVVAGRIVIVECGASGKVIVLASGRYRLRFREPKGRPVTLFFAPTKWKELPCGTRDWAVNLAYKPVRAGSSIHGEALALLF